MKDSIEGFYPVIPGRQKSVVKVFKKEAVEVKSLSIFSSCL